MSKQSRVMQILEQMLDSKATPEQACADCPELLPFVKKRLAQMEGVEQKINSIFPTTGSNGTGPPTRPLRRRPEIPGYAVGEVLGRGAVGVVYKARHMKLNRDVALKMLLSGDYASATELKRFMREAQSIASLRHANFVQVYDIGDLDGCPYFTMEFVDGGSLAQLLGGVPLPSARAATLMITLAEAMQAAHAGGVMHRDLKPSNILLMQDGTPKISDFGLARQLEGKSDLTHSGDRVGTPCYMAPEQAKGQSGAVGPPSDVYSLGAILYEAFTGRPPFQGETPGETERQLLIADPVSPSRLNGKVPRDLETICLKCLHKDPERRYSSAGALADDLRRYGKGEAIMARPIGALERGRKWILRHAAISVSIVGTLVLLLAVTSAGIWSFTQRAAAARTLEEDLLQVESLEAKSQWDDARLVQERVRARLSADTSATLRSRAEQNDKDLATVARLGAISRALSGRWGLTNSKFQNLLNNSSQYESAFRDAGLGTPAEPAEAVAARIRSKNIKTALLDALYDWVGSADDQHLHKWILQVAMMADPAPTQWAERAKDPKTWRSKAALVEVLETAPANPGCLRLTTTVADRLQALGGDGISYLKKLQRQHPGDFRTNYTLALACINAHQLADALRFTQAADALSQDYPILNNNLGAELLKDGRKEEAIEQFTIATEFDPTSARFKLNLAAALSEGGHYDESVDAYRRAFSLGADHDFSTAWYAVSLDGVGQVDEAVDVFSKLVIKTPHIIQAIYSPLPNFIRKGRAEKMRAAWQQGLEAGTTDAGDYIGYPEFCLYLDKEKEYHEACSMLLSNFSTTANPRLAEVIGRTILLRPATEDQTRMAAALIDRALHADLSAQEAWTKPYFQFSEALLEYRQGHFQASLTILDANVRKILGPCPYMLIAMSQSRLGNTAEAEHALETGMMLFNWSPSNAVERDSWLYHALRHEAESTILSCLPAFAAGNYQPRNNDERFCLTGYCQDKSLNLTSAQLYKDAFAADPEMSGSKYADYRYRAACAAALAGCGKGKDAGTLSIAERKQWRSQALVWMKSDLGEYEHSFTDAVRTRLILRTALTSWRSNPDLAEVRDPGNLQSLDPEEREQWSAFWKRVDSRIAFAGDGLK
jgi:tetratricopeptide (TPR) repeat protein/tRNA A-37 threonylcarbamoyl transferase component Bud32